ncbi:MAG: NADH:flavin oxidoreductase/NADH oxidase [Burkholderiales bacterium]
MTQTLLFSPWQLRDVVFRNRIMAAPMWQYAGHQWRPTDWHLMNLGRLADGGSGLVFQEGTTVERRGCGTVGDIGIWDDAAVPHLRRLVAIMRDCGAVPGIQLMHAGRKARQKPPDQGRGALQRSPEITDWDAWDVIAPSAITLPGESAAAPREMTGSDIRAVIDAFVAGARRADAAGYQVLDLHAAHGYLLHSFLSPLANRRGDAWGGSLANRMRFVLETVAGVRAVWPAGKPIFVRLSVIDGAAGGWTLEDSVTLVREMHRLGVDLIDCSAGGIAGSPLPAGQSASYGYQVDLAAAIRRETGVPTSAVGLIVHASHAERILREGACDLVALARELIHNPNWPVDAAIKLGDDIGHRVMKTRGGFWLERRAATVPGLRTSTQGETELSPPGNPG